MATPSKSAVDVVLGAGSFGTKTTGGLQCQADRAVIQSIIDEFKKRGHYIIDTARIYSDGTSEEILAELNYAGQGLKVDTKIPPGFLAPGSHSTANVALALKQSLEALKTKKVNVLYLHAPDRTVPFEETLGAVNEAYKQGHFEKFGLSNYTAEEVEKIVEITKAKGYVQPTVYQGSYNLVARKNEEALFPVLRKYGFSFYAYSPLAGSFLIGNTPRNQAEETAGSRFDPNAQIGAMYRNLYCKESLFDAVDTLKEVGKAHGGISVQEISLRWLVHHSQLSSKHGDTLITGGSKLANIQTTLDFTEKGPLPADVVKTIEDLWQKVKNDAPSYHF